MTSSEQRRRGYRAVMTVCVLGGVAYLIVGIVSHHIGFGVFGLVLMLAYGGWLTWRRGRSEKSAILAGEGVDERQRAINQRATALTGNLLVLAVLGGFLVSLAVQWESGVWVFGGLAALAGVSYAGALAYYTRHG